MLDIHSLADNDVCKYKVGIECGCADKSQPKHKMKKLTAEDADILWEDKDHVEIKVKDENEPLDDGDIFDAFFGD